MLIGICGGIHQIQSTSLGPTYDLTLFLGICAGKHSVQDFLVQRHAFIPLALQRQDTILSTSNSIPTVNGPANPDGSLSFPSPSALIDYVTAHWQTDFVTTSIHDETILDALAHRPFFLLLHVDAPIHTRWLRFLARQPPPSPPPTLETFLLHSEAHLYSPAHPLAPLRSRANLSLLNTASSLPLLHLALSTLNLQDTTRLRPSWDHYFMTLCSLAARRSNCMRRRVGCVLVRNRRVISTGYNGTPRHLTNCNEGGCPRCNGIASAPSTAQPAMTFASNGGAITLAVNGDGATIRAPNGGPPTPLPSASGGGGRDLHTCLCIHAEENALLEAGRERVGSEAVLYCNTCPCLTCSIKIVQVGIAEVVYSQSYYMDAEAARVFAEAGVTLRQFQPLSEGLVEVGDVLTEKGRVEQEMERLMDADGWREAEKVREAEEGPKGGEGEGGRECEAGAEGEGSRECGDSEDNLEAIEEGGARFMDSGRSPAGGV